MAKTNRKHNLKTIMAFFISNYVCANKFIKTQPVYTLLLYNKKS